MKTKILPVLLSVIVLSMVISPTYPTLTTAYAVELPPVLSEKCDLSLPPDKPISPDCELLNLIIAEEAARIAADANLQTQINNAVDGANEAIDEAVIALGIVSGLFGTAAAGCSVSCPATAVALGTLSALMATTAGILAAISFTS